jgi:hypothetical protein
MAFRERERFQTWLKAEGYEVIPQFHLLEELLEEFREYEEEERKRKEEDSAEKQLAKLEAKIKGQKHHKPLPVAKVINLSAARNRARSVANGNGARGVGRGNRAASASVQDVSRQPSSKQQPQGRSSRAASAGSVQGRRGRKD